MNELSYQRAKTVVCFESFKSAALYFDRVVPVNLGIVKGDPEYGDILMGYPEWIPSAALAHLIDGMEGDTKSYSHADRIMRIFSTQWPDFARQVSPYAKLWASNRKGGLPEYEVNQEYQKFQNAYFENSTIVDVKPIRQIVKEYASSVGFRSFCVAVNSENTNQVAHSDIGITLAQLNLIDAQSADWRQIIEVRKDKKSRQKLIRLRLFIHQNYSNRSLAFIEDDILRRVDEYEQVSKKFGLRTTISSLSMLLDAKSLQASIGSGLAASLFGGAVVGATTAAIVEIGKIILHIGEKRHDMRDWQLNHDFAYIFHTKKKLD